ncbi:unnamed protein product, partial [Musa hybrid cultivar]
PQSAAGNSPRLQNSRAGTWVANGKPRDIPHRDRRAAIVGTRTSLEFFKDGGDLRMKRKDRTLGTKWIMHEYRLHPSFFGGYPRNVGAIEGGTCNPGRGS